MNDTQARNVVALLQMDPLYYRNFGIYWWHIKTELKRMGYDQRQLSHLGDFADPTVDSVYKGRSATELTLAAFEYQADATFHQYNGVKHLDDEIGVYLLLDNDVE